MLAILAILAIGPLIILIKSIPANPADGSFPLRIMFVTVPLAIIVLIVLIVVVLLAPAVRPSLFPRSTRPVAGPRAVPPFVRPVAATVATATRHPLVFPRPVAITWTITWIITWSSDAGDVSFSRRFGAPPSMIDLRVPGRKNVHGGQAGSIFIKDHGLAILRDVGIHPIIQLLLFLDVRLISLDRGPLSPAGAFTEMPSGPSAVACKMPLAFHRPVMVSEIDVC